MKRHRTTYARDLTLCATQQDCLRFLIYTGVWPATMATRETGGKVRRFIIDMDERQAEELEGFATTAQMTPLVGQSGGKK